MGKFDKKKFNKEAPVAEILEPRMLFSADSLSALGGVLLNEDQDDTEQLLNLFPQIIPEASTENTESTQYVFIDARVPESESIIADIESNASGTVKVIVLETSDNGLEVIQQALAQADPDSVDAIHLVSHSLGPSVRLGADLLSVNTLATFESQIAEWGTALDQNADILIYGCDLGTNIDGVALMHALADVTGADVAISADNTGHHSQNGNWEFEIASGVIETETLVSDELQESWVNVLATWNSSTGVLIIDHTDDQYNQAEAATRYSSIDALMNHAGSAADGHQDQDISLREAISAINNDSVDPVTIQLMAGSYSNTIGGVDAENDNVDGDFDITASMTIIGTGQSNTLIDIAPASGPDKVRGFDLLGNVGTTDLKVTFSGLQITGGDAVGKGGGIRAYQAELTLEDVLITHNKAVDVGGGVYAQDSELSIVNSNIIENDAFEGAGVFISNGLPATISGSTIADNEAVLSGGGIYTATVLTITDTTFNNNDAATGGGVFVAASSQTNLISSDLVSNEAENGGAAFVNGTLNISDGSEVINNRADVSGGGVFVEGLLEAEQTLFHNNRAVAGDGGGIHMNNATLVISDSIVEANRAENSAAGRGGGIYVSGTSTIKDITVSGNFAYQGAGLYYLSGPDSTLENATIANNEAEEDGGGVLTVFNSTLDVFHSTITGNIAGDTGGAIDADGASLIRLKNSIIYLNISHDNPIHTGPSPQLSNQVESLGYNVISADQTAAQSDLDETFMDVHYTDIIQWSNIARTVDPKLSATMETDQGSFSKHFSLLSGSDAIDAGGGFERVDAFGVYSNEFVDVGATEFQAAGPVTKIFFVDQSTAAHSIYRMNEDGSALQQIVEPRNDVVTNTLPVEILDVAYDPKSRHLFYLAYIDLSGNDSHFISYVTSFGEATAGTNLRLSGPGAVFNYEYQAGVDYRSLALDVATTSDAATPNKLYVSQMRMSNNNDRIVTYDIDHTIDAANNYSLNTATMWNSKTTVLQEGIPITTLVSLDVKVVENSGPDDIYISWADAGNATTPHYVVVKNGAVYSAIQINDGTNPYPKSYVEAVTFNPDDDETYVAMNFGALKFEVGTTVSTAGFGVMPPSLLTDIEIQNHASGNRIWFVDTDGYIAYVDENLSLPAALVIPVAQNPNTLSIANVSPVNTAPRIDKNNQLDVTENNSGTGQVIITNTHLNSLDTSSAGDTAPEDIHYTITSDVLLQYGNITVDGAVDTTFTQDDIDNNRVAYLHDGSEPGPESFSFSVSDNDPNTVDTTGVFNIVISNANDDPTIVLANEDLSIDENDPLSSLIASVTTSDTDSTTVTLSINVVDHNGNSQPLATLSIADEIRSLSNYNYETNPEFDIEITADDNDGGSTTITRTVQIVNRNDDPTDIVILLNGGTATVPELSPGFVLGTLTTIDEDLASNPSESHTYTVENANDPTDARFEVAGNTLQLKPGEILDLNNESNLELIVTTTDVAGRPYQETFTFTVSNVNEDPYNLTLDTGAAGMAIPELQPGYQIGTLTTYDDDIGVAGDIHTYTVENANDATDTRFEVVGNVLQLKAGATLDLNDESSLDLRVTTTDSTNGSLDRVFSFIVTNMDENPTDITLLTGPSGTAIPELSPGHVFGTLTTIDDDIGVAGDTHTYTVQNVNDASDTRFEVVGNVLKLKAGEVLDLNDESTLSLEVTTTDSTNRTFTKTFSGTVANVDEDPNDLTLDTGIAGMLVPELNAGYQFGTLTTFDDDIGVAGDTHTYSVENANDITDNRFEVSGNVLKLKAGQKLDLNNESTLDLKVTTTDSTGKDFDRVFTFVITNVDEAPNDIHLTTPSGNMNVAELSPGLTIGTLSTIDDDIAPAADSHTYSVVNANDATDTRFQVTGNELELKPGAQLVLNNEATITLTVTTTDSTNFTFSKDYTFNVTNKNEAPTDIVLTPLAGNMDVQELNPGIALGTLATIDPDSIDTHTYSVANANDATDTRFQISGNQLELKPGEQLVLSDETSVTLTVTTEDSQGLTHSENFTFTVTNMNETPSDITLTTLSGNMDVPELTPGVVLGSLTTIDADIAPANDTHTYSVVNFFDASDTRFEVVGNQLKLKSGEQLVLNDETSLTLMVTTTDAAGLSYTENFNFKVTNLNESPTDITLATISGNMDIPELSAGIALGTLTTIDEDIASGNDSHTYSVVNANDATDTRFQVTGNQLELKPGAQLVLNNENTITLSVTTEDAQGQTYSENFTFAVTNTNEAPTDIQLTTASGDMTVPELTPGYSLATLGTADEDIVAANDTHTYTVVNAGDATDTRFQVIGNQLELKPGAQLLFNNEPSITLTVTTTDSTGLSHSKDFTFVVDNLNEAPTGITLDNTNVSELSAGAIVGTLSTTDPDNTDLTHSYTVDDNRFEVLGNQLKLVSEEELDIDETPQLVVNVVSTDSAGASVTVPMTITVDNINESPVVQSVPTALSVSAENPLSLSQLLFVDPDGDAIDITATMANGDPLPEWVVFDSVNMTVSLVDAPESAEDVNIAIVASDGIGGETTQPLFIAIERAPVAAPALPVEEPEPEQIVAEPIEAIVLPQDEAPEEPAAETPQPATEEPVALEQEELAVVEVSTVDLASLIAPIERVNLVEIVQTNSQITSIERDISVAQIETQIMTQTSFDLASAFNQPSDIEFKDLATEFDRQREEIEERAVTNKTVIGSSFTISSGLSVGYLLWLIRGGTLMGSVLTSLPAWRLVDPLPVLGSLGDDFGEDDESLEQMVDNEDDQDHDETQTRAA